MFDRIYVDIYSYGGKLQQNKENLFIAKKNELFLNKENSKILLYVLCYIDS